MSRKISLIESRILMYIGNGIAWFVYGVLSFFNNVVCDILSAVFLVVGIIVLILGMSSKEKDDEMSRHNLLKAKANTMDLLKIIILIVLSISSAIGIMRTLFPSLNEIVFLSIKTVVPLIIGGSEIMTGSLFLKYERDGD